MFDLPKTGRRLLQVGVSSLLATAGLGSPLLAGPLTPKLSGDFRLRLENDWDSVTAAGVARADRARSRIRARLAATSTLSKGITFNLRLRTGGKGSQQNANDTWADFSGNRPESFGLSLDRFELAWSGKHASVSVGRMTYPFFTQNEYMWDADIDPLGVAASGTVPLGGKRSLKFTGGHFTLPVGLIDYSGQLTAGQVTYADSHATLAAGLFHTAHSRTDPDRLTLLDGNGQRDYTVLALDGRYARKVGKVPLTLGADMFRNLEHYTDPADSIGLANADRRTGYVLSAALGDVAAPHHVQVGYRYFHIERLAVNASYSHDDVSRFGVGPQAANSDLAGHDIYANYVVNKHLTVGIRSMLVHRLSNAENGKRARLDIVYSF